jgi:hypothetical protein
MKKKNNTYLLHSALYSMIASISPVLGESLSDEQSDHYTTYFGPSNHSEDAYLQETAQSVSAVRATIKQEVDDRDFPDELHDLLIASLTSNPNAIQHLESFHTTKVTNNDLSNFLDKAKAWVDKHYEVDKKKTTDTLNAEVHIQYPQWKEDLEPYSLPSIVNNNGNTQPDTTQTPPPIDKIILTASGLTYGEDVKVTIDGKNLSGKTGAFTLTQYTQPVKGYGLFSGKTTLDAASFQMPADGVLTLQHLDAGDYEVTLTVENLSTKINITVDRKKLTLKELTVPPKVWDGTTKAAIKYAMLEGLIEDDSVRLSYSANFNNADAGIDKEVTVTFGLEDVAAKNYTLSPRVYTLLSSITTPVVTVTGTVKEFFAGEPLIRSGFGGGDELVIPLTDPVVAGYSVQISSTNGASYTYTDTTSTTISDDGYDITIDFAGADDDGNTFTPQSLDTLTIKVTNNEETGTTNIPI